MSALPRITIVTPSFNQGRFLDETIRSVLDQNYPNLEYIVVDGGSTDDSVAVIKRYADRLTHWVSEPDAGQSHAINKGFARATGDVFGYINSDDFLYPGALDCVAKAWAGGARWVQGWVMTLEADGGQWPELPRPMGNLADWFVRNPIPQQASFWDARFTRELGPFREDFRYAFDYEFWMRMRVRAGVRPALVHRCLGSYRLHAASKTVSEQAQFVPEFERIRAEYLPLLTPRDRQRVARARRTHAAGLRATRAWQALNAADLPTASRQAAESLKLAPTSPDAWRLWLCTKRAQWRAKVRPTGTEAVPDRTAMAANPAVTAATEVATPPAGGAARR